VTYYVIFPNANNRFTTLENIAYPSGNHVFLDFWEAEGLTDANFIEQALCNAAEACGATVLEIKLHVFGENSGITGVALLAESHITIHTWPEFAYAALDVFVCGKCQAEQAIEVLQALFKPATVKINRVMRGVHE
jgi:S-adenosylmethionine decarboxylase